MKVLVALLSLAAPLLAAEAANQSILNAAFFVATQTCDGEAAWHVPFDGFWHPNPINGWVDSVGLPSFSHCELKVRDSVVTIDTRLGASCFTLGPNRVDEVRCFPILGSD